jgi:hypothetical protein
MIEVLKEALQLASKIIDRQPDVDPRLFALACNTICIGQYKIDGVSKDQFINMQHQLWKTMAEFQKNEDDELEKEKEEFLSGCLDELSEKMPDVMKMVSEKAEERGDGFLFSPEFRAGMSKFGDMDVGEALGNRDFLDALLDHAGMDQKAKNSLWEKVDRPDLKG